LGIKSPPSKNPKPVSIKVGFVYEVGGEVLDVQDLHIPGELWEAANTALDFPSEHGIVIGENSTPQELPHVTSARNTIVNGAVNGLVKILAAKFSKNDTMNGSKKQ